MVKKDDVTFSMQKVAKTWTSKRLYEILKDGKVILKLKDEEDAKSVVDYLNKNKCKECDGKGSKKSVKKTAKKSSKKSTKKSTKSKKSTKKSSDE